MQKPPARQEIADKVPTAEAGLLLVMDGKGRIVRCSPACQALSGLDEDDILGRPIWDFLVSDDDVSAMRRMLQELSSGAASSEAECAVRTRDGTAKRILWTGIAVSDDAGETGLIAATGVLLERKLAEQGLRDREARLHAVVTTAVDGIITIDERGIIDTINPAALSLFGFEADEVVGKNVSVLMPEPHHAGHDGYLKAYRDTGEAKIIGIGRELVGRRKDGSTFPMDLSVSEMNVAGRQMFTGIVRDISERKLAEDEIRAQTVELEAANKEMEAFNYSVSHDLRAPLRIVDGFSGILLEKHADALDEKSKHYLRRIRAGTGRMADLIDDMLKLSRSTRGELKRVKVDLSSIARSVAARLRETAPERKVDIRIQPNVSANGDPRFLTVVLDNLVGNAWKYTGPKEHATIAFEASEENGEIVFSVRDDGVGFDMAYADKLFKPFQRLHRSDEFEGNGVGLATVQRIVHRHGGRVWAEGKIDRGATIYFTL